MPDQTVLLPYQPTTMSTAQLAAVSYLARFAGHTHHLYAYQLNRWFASGSSRSPRPSPSIAAPSPTCWSCVSWKLAAASAPPGRWSCARAPVGRSTDRRDAYRMVARIAKAAGIPRHISPHSLRHAAITTPSTPASRLRRRPLPHRIRRRRLRINPSCVVSAQIAAFCGGGLGRHTFWSPGRPLRMTSHPATRSAPCGVPRSSCSACSTGGEQRVEVCGGVGALRVEVEEEPGGPAELPAGSSVGIGTQPDGTLDGLEGDVPDQPAAVSIGSTMSGSLWAKGPGAPGGGMGRSRPPRSTPRCGSWPAPCPGGASWSRRSPPSRSSWAPSSRSFVWRQATRASRATPETT